MKCKWILLVASVGWAQTNPASIAARNWRQTHERAIIDEYFQLLSIPNIATDQVNIRRNADLIVAMMKKPEIHEPRNTRNAASQ